MERQVPGFPWIAGNGSGHTFPGQSGFWARSYPATFSTFTLLSPASFHPALSPVVPPLRCPLRKRRLKYISDSSPITSFVSLLPVPGFSLFSLQSGRGTGPCPLSLWHRGRVSRSRFLSWGRILVRDYRGLFFRRFRGPNGSLVPTGGRWRRGRFLVFFSLTVDWAVLLAGA